MKARISQVIVARAPMAITLAVLTLAAGAAHAGRTCEAAKLTPQTIERGMGLAQRTADALEQAYAKDGTRVVLLARAGQDLSKYSQTWSHVGWAYRTPEGPWRVVHKLNECGTDQSIITRQGLGEFFLDDLWRYEAAWVAPSPSCRARCGRCCRTTAAPARCTSAATAWSATPGARATSSRTNGPSRRWRWPPNPACGSGSRPRPGCG